MATRVRYGSIDEYIASFPADTQAQLQTLREMILAAEPRLQEKISYHMPTFALDDNLICFAAWKHHIGFYGTPTTGSRALKKKLAAYAGPKGSLKFPLDEPLPEALVRQVVKLRVAEYLKERKTGTKKNTAA